LHTTGKPPPPTGSVEKKKGPVFPPGLLEKSNN
jgi:hypothetical protein